MNLKLWIFLTLILGLFLTACSGSASLVEDASAETGLFEPVSPKVVKEASLPVSESSSVVTDAYKTEVDDQGEVEVAITPLNLDTAATSLDFEVAMDTHSVDLSMDLSELAILTTDNGRSVEAVGWDAVPGGHHVSGQLSFPALLDGTPLLENASSLTLSIREIDVPTRIFTWTLAK